MYQKKKYYKNLYNNNNKRFIPQSILKKFKTFSKYKKYKKLYDLRKKIPKNVSYLHFNRKSKQGIFLKNPSTKDIKYPFFLKLKLVNEYIKKK